MTIRADRVRQLRQEKGLSQQALANAARVSQTTIDKIENGRSLTSRAIHRIAQVLGVEASELDPEVGALTAPHIRPWRDNAPDADNGIVLTHAEHEAFKVANDMRVLERAAAIGGEIALLGAAEGGAGALKISQDPIGTVARPPALNGVHNAYAVYVVGTSMEPEFEHGDEAYVNPKLPPIPGSTCIFYTNDPHDDRAMIKRLVRVTADEWHVRQWNPPEGQDRDFTVSRADWPVCHRVVGKNYRR
ncbi:MAG TPA: LexA family transcriptional regulator [Microvirga sp.]|nr:LexA family transcriptional regulator [Microvirga sp.]